METLRPLGKVHFEFLEKLHRGEDIDLARTSLPSFSLPKWKPSIGKIDLFLGTKELPLFLGKARLDWLKTSPFGDQLYAIAGKVVVDISIEIYERGYFMFTLNLPYFSDPRSRPAGSKLIYKNNHQARSIGENNNLEKIQALILFDTFKVEVFKGCMKTVEESSRKAKESLEEAFDFFLPSIAADFLEDI